MRFPLFAALLLAFSCGVPEVKLTPLQEAQLAVNDVTQAILTGNKNLFLTRFKAQNDDPPDIVSILMETQKFGIQSHYGDTPPQLTDLKDEGGGNFSAAVFSPKFNAVSPKRLHFWRDASGFVFWTGVTPYAPKAPGNVVQQAFNPQMKTYDVWNQAAVGHYWMTLFRTGQALSCFSGTNTCIDVDPSPPYGPFVINAGWSGYFTINANVSGSQWAVARVDPVNFYCGCTTHTSTAPSSCCWVNAWGWDMWWPGNDTNAADSFTCGAPGSCPN